MIWLFAIFLLSVFALNANQTLPNLPSGGSLIIDIVKRNSSELSRTILSEPQIILFAGTAPLPPENGRSGEVVPFSPFDGCGPLAFDPKYHVKNSKGNAEFMSSSNSTSFVVLIKKSKQCGYGDIFKQVSQVPHVTGILVYDPVDDPDSLDMLELFDGNIRVPGFLISTTLGEDLLKKVNKYREAISNNADDPWVSATLIYVPVKFNLTKVFQILLVVVVIVLILSLIVSILVNYNFYQGRQSTWTSLAPPPPPRRKIEDIEINDEFIEKIPYRVYQRTESSLDLKEQDLNNKMTEQDWEDYRRRHTHNDSCPICIDEFKYGETVRQLHCGHCYHPHCISPWLKTRSPLCPLCKIDVRASMIEAEELAFVRHLRKLEENKKNQVISESDKLKNNDCEMKEVLVVSPSSDLRPRQTSFDSIPLDKESEQ